jgi:hypothetical protein
MNDRIDTITIADIERRIALHEQAIKDLCESGLRLDEAAEWSGVQAMTWLLGHGYRTDRDARALIAQVVRERQEDQHG